MVQKRFRGRVVIASATIQDRTVRKTADETVNNSNTLQDDNELLFAVGANEIWAFQMFIRYDSSAAADLNIGWSVPSGTTLRWKGSGLTGTSTMSESDEDAIGTMGVGTEEASSYDGVVVVGATAGSVTLRWTQFTATVADTTMRVNSYIIIHRLA